MCEDSYSEYMLTGQVSLEWASYTCPKSGAVSQRSSEIIVVQHWPMTQSMTRTPSLPSDV